MNPTLAMMMLVAALLVPAGATRAEAPPRLKWSSKLESVTGNRLDPVAVGRRLFVDAFYHLAELDASSGKRVRKLKTDCNNFLNDIVVVDKRLLTVCEDKGTEEGPSPLRHERDATLEVFDVRAGRRLWMRHGVHAEPIAVSGARVLVVERGRLLALEVQSGKKLWQAVEKAGERPTGLVADEKRVIVQNEAGDVMAHDPATGKRVWTRRLPGAPRARAAIGDGVVYVGRIQEARGDHWVGRLSALELKSGKVLWQKKLPGQQVFFPPAVGEDAIYLATMSHAEGPGGLYALAPKTGQQLWRTDIVIDADGHDFTPLLLGDRLLLWSADRAELRKQAVSTSYGLQSIDRRTGKLHWRYLPPAREKRVLSRPLPVGGLLIFTDGTRAYGLQPAPAGRSAKLPALRRDGS